MTRRIRVIQYGLGAMGAGMVKMMLQKENIDVVAAISATGRNRGLDLGEAIGLDGRVGIAVSDDPIGVVGAVEADVVLHATCSALGQALEEILPILAAHKNVVTIAEEALFPTRRNKHLFHELDRAAKENQVTILGTGINPGFMMDFLPLSMTGIMLAVDSIRMRRVVNYGRYGKSVWEHIGVGKDLQAFNRGLEAGEIALHVGLEQTVSITAHALGWQLDRITEDREAIVSRTLRQTGFGAVHPGTVGGFRQLAVGWKGGEALVTQELIGLIEPDQNEDGVAVGNEVWLDGDPSVHLFVGGEFADQGGKGTCAHAVNCIPQVVDARPGFLTVIDLPPAICLKGKQS